MEKAFQNKKFVMNRWIFIASLIILSNQSLGQDCQRYLDEAQRAYFNGNLELVVSSLEECASNNQLNTEDQESALELLINSLLLLNEDEEADKYMLQLLKTNPLYQVRSNELVKFKRLFESYRMKPTYNIGIVAGFASPTYSILQYRSLGSISQESDQYESNPGFAAGVVIDKYLTNRVFFSAGLIYNRYNYQTEEILLTYQKSSIEERLSYINLPIQIGYQLEFSNYEAFISGGIGTNFLLSSKADLELFGIRSEDPITIIPGVPEKVENIDLKHQRSNVIFNYIASLGIRRTIGLYGVEVRAQYDFGLNNLVDEKNRFSNEQVWRTYSYVPNDFKLDAFKIMFGVTRRFSTPVKSIQK